MDEKYDGSIDRHYTNYNNNMWNVDVIFYINCVHKCITYVELRLMMTWLNPCDHECKVTQIHLPFFPHTSEWYYHMCSTSMGEFVRND